MTVLSINSSTTHLIYYYPEGGILGTSFRWYLLRFGRRRCRNKWQWWMLITFPICQRLHSMLYFIVLHDPVLFNFMELLVITLFFPINTRYNFLLLLITCCITCTRSLIYEEKKFIIHQTKSQRHAIINIRFDDDRQYDLIPFHFPPHRSPSCSIRIWEYKY